MSVGKNMTAGIATNLVVFGLGILLSVVLRRGLGPDASGVYALLVTTNGLLANVINLSVGAACSTLLARGRYRLGEVNTVACILALALGVAGLIAVSLAFSALHDSLFPHVPFTYLLVALLLLPTTIYQLYWNAMMAGLNRVLLLNQFNLGLNIANTVLMVLAIGVLGLGIPGFLGAWATTALGGALVSLVLAARMDRPAWPPGRAALRELLGFGLRGHGASVAHHVFLRFDWYAVNALVGIRGVGLYSLASSLAEKLWVPLDGINSAALGKVAQLPREESALLTAKVTRTAVLLMVAAGVPFAVVSPWLIPFLYGPAFAAAVLPLVVLLAGVPCFAVMLVVNSYIVGQMGRPGLLSIISWFQLGISVVLYLVLIGWGGILGAAIASSLTYGLAMVCTLVVFLRDSGLRVAEVLVPRPADFADYARVLRAVWQRVPVPHRPARRPS